MEQRSNIVLVGDDNIILAAARHVTPRMSRRPVLPQTPYELPPPQAKRDPRQATAAELRAAIPGGQPDLARALVGVYRGLSPLAAREVVYRALGRTLVPTGADLPWDALAEALRRLWQTPGHRILLSMRAKQSHLRHMRSRICPERVLALR